MLRVGIVGVTGYAGEELVTVLLRHPEVSISHCSAKIEKPLAVGEIFPRFRNRLNLTCTLPDVRQAAAKSDLVMLALPHTVSMDFVPALLKAGRKVIDLSADYRLKDSAVYEQFYGCAHKDKGNIPHAVYGLPELYREKIRVSSFIANPGCYPTAAILSLAPLCACAGKVIDTGSIIIDAKSGVTGAGRKLAEGFMFSEANEDFKAYRVNRHQHAPEIDQELSSLAGKKVKVTFVPHLLPVNRGIVETIYVKKSLPQKRDPASHKTNGGKKVKGKRQKVIEIYRKFYKNEPFVRVRDEGEFPRLKDVVGTNFCDIGIQEEADSVIIIAAIDNLLKGASGQAVQNLNIMYHFPENTGLV